MSGNRISVISNSGTVNSARKPFDLFVKKHYYATLTNEGAGAIITWNDGGPWLEDSITIAGTRYLLTKQLDAPGVYLLPHFELVYSIQAGCHPGNCMISSDLNFIAEWRGDSWPPGLRCYNRGIITGEVDGVSIFRRYSSIREFSLSSIESITEHIEFTSDGKLILETHMRGPVWFGVYLPRVYSDKVTVDIVEGQLIEHKSIDPLAWGAALLAALVFVSGVLVLVKSRKKLRAKAP